MCYLLYTEKGSLKLGIDGKCSLHKSGVNFAPLVLPSSGSGNPEGCILKNTHTLGYRPFALERLGVDCRLLCCGFTRQQKVKHGREKTRQREQ